MSVIPFTLRNELISSLRSIEAETGKVFLGLADTLPSLVAEMKESLAQSENTLICMADTTGHDAALAGCRDELEISALVSKTRTVMDNGSEEFQRISHGYTTLFSDLQQSIGQLETIDRLIGRIKLDSEDMELVSLNAMTVALKAGSAGRAFSYITEELKRLATRTIVLSEQISTRGTELISGFKEFEHTLQEARSFQAELFENFQNRIGRSFEEFYLAVRATVDGLHELRERSADLQAPINGMMEAIQLQDLIRQSIDHIILALEAIKPEDELVDDESLLDELSFLLSIPELAATLIDDVASQIEESVATFVRLTSDAKSRLDALERDRREFIDGKKRLSDGQELDLDHLFESTAIMLNDLLRDIEANIANKAVLVSGSETITASVQALEEQFRLFDTIVTRFHNVDIASRIEVAKQERLRQMGTSAEQMTALTGQIERDVDESLLATREFIGETASIIDRYREQYAEERSFVTSFSDRLSNANHELNEARRGVTSTVAEFSLFTDGFFRVFTLNAENGTRLSSLADSIRGLKTKLTAMQEAIEGRYREALRSRGIDNWEISNDRLKAIIDRFTIFSHKKQAGNIVGVEVDEGVEAGDITFF